MFDIAIIGGGPGGYVAAEKAGKNGLTTILFEKKDLGGVCLNEGCIPTKTMLYSAKLYDQARKSEKYGVHVEEALLDYKKMTDRKKKEEAPAAPPAPPAPSKEEVLLTEIRDLLKEKK